MISTPAIQALIRESKTYRITSEIQTGAKYGMITLDSYLMALYEAGKIGYEDLITKSQDPESIVIKLEESQRKKR
jgi:twitching motility protein PilT